MAGGNGMKVGVLIPAFNEEEGLPPLLRSLTSIPKEDILVVDDGSEDKTSEVARAEGVSVVKHAANLGKGAAQQSGFVHFLQRGYESIITMDGDGQHDPLEIPLFLKKAREGADVVVGTRRLNLAEMPLVRYLTNRATSFVVSVLARTRIKDSQSGFRLIRAEVLREVSLTTVKYDAESEILIKAGRRGFRIESLPIKTIYRGERSSINPVLDTLRFIRLAVRGLWI